MLFPRACEIALSLKREANLAMAIRQVARSVGPLLGERLSELFLGLRRLERRGKIAEGEICFCQFREQFDAQTSCIDALARAGQFAEGVAGCVEQRFGDLRADSPGFVIVVDEIDIPPRGIERQGIAVCGLLCPIVGEASFTDSDTYCPQCKH